MPSNKPRAPKFRSLLISTTLPFALIACATQVTVNRPAEGCASEVPSEYVAGVVHDDFPGANADTGAWIAHAQAESDNLDIANAREKTTVNIVTLCEAHDKALVDSLTKRPWWQLGH